MAGPGPASQKVRPVRKSTVCGISNKINKIGKAQALSSRSAIRIPASDLLQYETAGASRHSYSTTRGLKRGLGGLHTPTRPFLFPRIFFANGSGAALYLVAAPGRKTARTLLLGPLFIVGRGPRAQNRKNTFAGAA